MSNIAEKPQNKFANTLEVVNTWSEEEKNNFVRLLQKDMEEKTTLKDSESNKKYSRHGLIGTRLYVMWTTIKRQCFNEKNASFKNYGAKGIVVCQEWKEQFLEFHNWAMQNGYTESSYLRRKDISGSFSPDNCFFFNKVTGNNEKVLSSKKVRPEKSKYLMNLWANLKSGCKNPKSALFKANGGTGVSFYSGWSSFKDFHKWALESGYTPGLKLSRKDLNANYEPSNCEWGSPQQKKNANSLKVTIGEEVKTIAEWSEKLGITVGAFKARINKGYTGVHLLKGRKILIEFQGELCTLKEIAAKTGLSYQVIYSRYSKGMESEKITGPLTREMNKLYTISGESKTINQWSDKSGISYGTIHARVQRGWKNFELIYPLFYRGRKYSQNELAA